MMMTLWKIISLIIKKMNKLDKILKEFVHQFDIDKIKDRSEHKYFEGAEAEKRVVVYLRKNLKDHIRSFETIDSDTDT